MRHFKKRLLDPSDVQAGYLVSTLLIIHEVLLTSLIVGNAGYTEIDWKVRVAERLYYSVLTARWVESAILTWLPTPEEGI